jgi:hypothetical protein
MRGEAGEQGARAVAAKPRFGEAPRGAHRGHAELGQKEGMTRHAERGQDIVAEAGPGGSKRLEERLPGFAIGAKIGGGAEDGTLQQHGGAVIQRVG